MRIGIYHGYELTGSGSNEYTRYLSRALAMAGHEVHLLCREPRPETIPHVAEACDWSSDGVPSELFHRKTEVGGRVTLHRLPHASVRPVFLTDKQREGDVRAFTRLTDEELAEYHDLNVRVLTAILQQHRLDVLHANHLVYQPVAAAEACRATGTPLVVFPHGSSIEYTLRADARYLQPVLQALRASHGIISGNHEVKERILALYPEHEAELGQKTRIVGVGVDTALFAPVERTGRKSMLAPLRHAGAPDGKRSEQTAALRARLDEGDIDAVQAYFDAYDHGGPDADLAAKLDAVPWEEGQVLLFVGALTAGKGLQSVITALPALLERRPDVHLVVVGSGAYRETLEGLVHAIAGGDGELLDALTSRGWDLDRSEETGPWKDVAAHLADAERRAVVLAAGPDFFGHVHFVGRLSHALLQHVFPCADAAVFPSLVPEAYPLVLMESLSNGIPPAVTDFSGFADGLQTLVPLLGRECVDSFRLPLDAAHRVAGIAQRLDELLEYAADPKLKPALRAVAVEHFDWKVRASQMVAAYESILALSRR